MNQHIHLTERSRQLARLQHARRDLTQANTVAEITSVRDKAESVRSHAQRASLGLEIQNYAAELKLQAERLAGHFISELKLRGGDRKSSQSGHHLKLKDLGIDKNQSARWQLEATVPEAQFREFVRQLHAAGEEISSAALLRLARSLRRPALRGALDGSTFALRPVSTESHLLTPRAVSWGVMGDDIDEIAELVAEIRQHHRLLTNVVESICRQAAIDPNSTDHRAIRRYLTEIGAHLDRIARGLQRLGHHRIGRTNGRGAH
jgi:hypothetical protein